MMMTKWAYNVGSHGETFQITPEWQRTMQVHERKLVLLETIEGKREKDTRLVIVTIDEKQMSYVYALQSNSIAINNVGKVFKLWKSFVGST